MTETDTNVFVSPAITFNADEEFKVRFEGDWAQNYGAQGIDEPYGIILGSPINTLVQDGKNMAVPTNGDYIITLDLRSTPTITVTAVTE